LPVYNGEEFLAEAIESILSSQTKKEFELIVVDDGSTDKTNEILQIFSKDPRVVLVTRTEHGGIVKALNDGIGVARGKYIARMDADDIASPDRLMRQLKFLCEHPEVDIVGGAVEIFGSGSNTKTKLVEFPCSVGAVHWSMFFNCCLVHPTVMARRTVFDKFQYNEKYNHVEDYALWLEIVTTSPLKIANLPKPVVLHLRKHSNNISSKYRQIQQQNMELLLVQTFEKIFHHKKFDNMLVKSIISRKIETCDIEERISDLFESLEKYLLSQPHFTDQERQDLRDEATKQLGEFASLALKCYHNPSDCLLWRKWLSRNPTQHLRTLITLLHVPSPTVSVQPNIPFLQQKTDEPKTNACSIICFSKNRSFQLREYLRSVSTYFDTNEFKLYIYVLYIASPKLEKSYQRLKQLFPTVYFVEETNFAHQLKDLVYSCPSDFILWGVDDVFYYRKINLKQHMEILKQRPEILFSHLRLSPNITYCHPADSFSRLPNFTSVSCPCPPNSTPSEPCLTPNNNILLYNRFEGTNDWNYPFELCATLMRKRDVIETLETIEQINGMEGFSHPNKLEVCGSRVFSKNLHPKHRLGLCLCVQKPVLSVITVNRVQEVCQNRTYDEIDLDTLDNYFWNDRQLDDAYYRNTEFRSVHIGDFVLK